MGRGPATGQWPHWAMVFGGVQEEELQLNEGYLWSGAPRDGNNPEAKTLLPQIRQLLAEEKYIEADKMARSMMGRNPLIWL